MPYLSLQLLRKSAFYCSVFLVAQPTSGMEFPEFRHEFVCVVFLLCGVWAYFRYQIHPDRNHDRKNREPENKRLGATA